MLEKKIVVIDDDESIRKTFFMILHGKYKVYLAKDSKESLQRFGKTQIDLIIADLKLPDLSGLETINKFRECGFKGEVILISAYPGLVNMKELSRLSIAHFFIKPLDLKVLNQAIDYLLCTKNGSERRV